MNGILISDRSDKPIYRQLSEQIASKIINGDLPPGFNLPAIRTAAREFRISVITVKKAWEELEREGLISTSPGRGCFVAEMEKSGLENKKRLLAEAQLKIDIEFYKTLGLKKSDFFKLIEVLYPDF